MNIDDFKRVLQTFADKPADVDLDKGRLLVQIGSELIEGRIFNEAGLLYVEENKYKGPVEMWIANRIGNLPSLADRLIDYIPKEKSFVSPSGSLLDYLDQNPSEKPELFDNAEECIMKVLYRRPAGVTSLLYLTSDAGEGKTTLINNLAYQQAKDFKEKKTPWLLLPIQLGGRSFLRFDDIVIGTLVNRFRFQYFYFDSLIELIRLGVIVLALDGFEEMFIEDSSGEAVSSLGNLMANLKSEGTVLISARKAYFEYKSFLTQSRLFDSLDSNSVTFSRFSLNRWSKAHFIDYCKKIKIAGAEKIYKESVDNIGTVHPLITRAVLATKFIKVIKSDRTSLLNLLRDNPSQYFQKFLNTLTNREIAEKWLDRSGEAAKPLLSIELHHEMLSDIAEEMWISKTHSLPASLLDLTCECFCEKNKIEPAISRQVLGRIKEHALIHLDTLSGNYSFDHEEFFEYYLGLSLGNKIIKKDFAGARSILRLSLVAEFAMEITCHELVNSGVNLLEYVGFLENICSDESLGACTRENSGGLIVRLIDNIDGEGCVIKDVTFPPGVFKNTNGKILNFNFESCYFYPTLFGGEFENCSFIKCEFQRIELDSTKKYPISVSSSIFHSVIQSKSDLEIFNPDVIIQILENHGFIFKSDQKKLFHQKEFQVEEDVALFERVVRYFLRSSLISENMIHTRLGDKYTEFIKDILPHLLKYKILEEIQMRGSSKARGFKLIIPMGKINEALSKCDGRFATLLEILAR